MRRNHHQYRKSLAKVSVLFPLCYNICSKIYVQAIVYHRWNGCSLPVTITGIVVRDDEHPYLAYFPEISIRDFIGAVSIFPRCHFIHCQGRSRRAQCIQVRYGTLIVSRKHGPLTSTVIREHIENLDNPGGEQFVTDIKTTFPDIASRS